MKDKKKTNIWLFIKNTEKNFFFTKYFETEFEKDKYKRRLKYIPNLRLVEDSTDIYYNYDQVIIWNEKKEFKKRQITLESMQYLNFQKSV